jgi:ADP-ribosylglycohydrolase
MTIKAHDLHDAALGCLLGACVGDAAGATLEFLGHTPAPAEVEWAMAIPGGGVWQVAPGQITDDGELALCLAGALAGRAAFDVEAVARAYDAWVRSGPFDIGNTTARALGAPGRLRLAADESYAAAMAGAAARHCLESKANGSLMRIAPLGMWGHGCNEDELADHAAADARLSHPNSSCQAAAACYVLAVAGLLRHPGDRRRAFDRARRWAAAHANAEVRGWLEEAGANLRAPYTPQDGFVRIAFTHAFRHLWLGTGYVEAIRETLAGGGDTDTNACIVGGLVGAACGARAIPDFMREPLLSCDTTRGAHPRPAFLSTRQIPELVERLI